MDRRTLLQLVGVGVLALVGGIGTATADPLPIVDPGFTLPPLPPLPPLPTIPGLPVPSMPPLLPRVPAPSGVITQLPGDGNLLALTVDDGTTSDVVAAYAQLCRDTGFRITFFPNGVNRSWTDNAPALRPMVESGQVVLGNHTWSHPDITTLSAAALADQINRNADFLRNVYGVSGTPFFRPPYGRHNAMTDRVAADLGYRTVTLWNGTIGDSRIVTEADVVAAAKQSFQPQAIVLCHANQRVVPRTFPRLVDIVNSRSLRTVTLSDVYS
ncbi:polysaccharide deacetylase family protein [Rhodococcus spelaei]|uniref:Polysaccharide deacetylase family protein n=1 Tax=Rhodococcus spelaei TaxID=2546320 RepID=A0A541B7N0_9NOCA|nr:polysaccharide deacetylase family protein [Rhodococcus spelaei]TQF68325.1 polysaccharide deacetylase family protein [Rhodococcus spelaei]